MWVYECHGFVDSIVHPNALCFVINLKVQLDVVNCVVSRPTISSYAVWLNILRKHDKIAEHKTINCNTVEAHCYVGSMEDNETLGQEMYRRKKEKNE